MQTLSQVNQSCSFVNLEGTYEGGFHLWDCGTSLSEYIQENPGAVKGLRVVELGCGHGIPGITCLLEGASEVFFQDFNMEVLQSVTVPNVILNVAKSDSLGKIDIDHLNGISSFFSGDWGLLSEALTVNGKFDLVISSDTVYQKNHHAKLLQLLKDTLSNTGVALFSGKTIYGAGGGIDQFKEFVQRDGTFSVKVVKEQQVARDGVDNVRKVLCLSKK